MTREEWLHKISQAMAPRFADLGYPLPSNIFVSVGWPSTRPLAKTKKRLGECWYAGEPNPHIYISPLLTQQDALHVLLHELVHAALPPKTGHKKPFGALAGQLGLQRPWTSTSPSDECAEWLDSLTADVGLYPHEPIAPREAGEKKQSTRMIKLMCGCGRILRGARKTVEAGPVVCGVCQAPFEVQEPEEEQEEQDDS